MARPIALSKLPLNPRQGQGSGEWSEPARRVVHRLAPASAHIIRMTISRQGSFVCAGACQAQSTDGHTGPWDQSIRPFIFLNNRFRPPDLMRVMMQSRAWMIGKTPHLVPAVLWTRTNRSRRLTNESKPAHAHTQRAKGQRSGRGRPRTSAGSGSRRRAGASGSAAAASTDPVVKTGMSALVSAFGQAARAAAKALENAGRLLEVSPYVEHRTWYYWTTGRSI